MAGKGRASGAAGGGGPTREQIAEKERIAAQMAEEQRQREEVMRREESEARARAEAANRAAEEGAALQQAYTRFTGHETITDAARDRSIPAEMRQQFVSNVRGMRDTVMKEKPASIAAKFKADGHTVETYGVGDRQLRQMLTAGGIKPIRGMTAAEQLAAISGVAGVGLTGWRFTISGSNDSIHIEGRGPGGGSVSYSIARRWNSEVGRETPMLGYHGFFPGQARGAGVSYTAMPRMFIMARASGIHGLGFSAGTGSMTGSVAWPLLGARFLDAQQSRRAMEYMAQASGNRQWLRLRDPRDMIGNDRLTREWKQYARNLPDMPSMGLSLLGPQARVDGRYLNKSTLESAYRMIRRM